MKKRLLSIALAFCILFGLFGCFNTNNNVAENTDNLVIAINNASLINCDDTVGVTFGLDIVVTGVNDRSVGFIVDETNSYVSVNEQSYTLTISAGVPDGYVFRLTVYSQIDRSKNTFKDFTVRTQEEEGEQPITPPEVDNKPLGPDAPVVPELGDGMPVYLSNGRIKAPETNLVDDFSEGIDEEKWYLSTQTWGGLPNYNGCRSENVSYTSDGILLLKTQGLYSTDVPLSGAAVITRKPYGAGSYQVAMKVVPRLGVCNAMWTFYYGRGGQDNHEIDIELPGHKTPGGGEIGYDRVLNTNWLSETVNTSQGVFTETPANDGDWHLYRFDWHTYPTPRIDYYVDGVLTHSETELVPSIKGLFWIGAWLPRNWCGQPDFEVDYMMVDWFSFTPFNQPTQDGFFTPASYETNYDKYPKLPVQMPETDYISNGSFTGNASAWKTHGDATITGLNVGGQMKINGDAYASQTITAVYEGFKYDLTALAKATGRGAVEVTFYDRRDNLISSGTQSFEISSVDYSSIKGEIVAPSGSNYMVIRLLSSSGTTYFDDISIKLK